MHKNASDSKYLSAEYNNILFQRAVHYFLLQFSSRFKVATEGLLPLVTSVNTGNIVMEEMLFLHNSKL